MKPFWDVTKTKWSVYLGAVVVFLPEIQAKLPEFIKYLPPGKLEAWMAGPGMRILGILIVVLRVRRDFLDLLRGMRAQGASVHN